MSMATINLVTNYNGTDHDVVLVVADSGIWTLEAPTLRPLLTAAERLDYEVHVWELPQVRPFRRSMSA